MTPGRFPPVTSLDKVRVTHNNNNDTMNKPELFDDSHQATYCPEDDKLRLYVGRVPNDEYKALRAEGWISTPKQSENGQGEFAATWTTKREDTALSYAGCITDEDAGPVDRAADRAERFGGYLDKRLSEATGHADRYDNRDSAHGFQSYAAGVRSADRHDRIATRAVNAWDKAEYWQRRTAGVISSALYKSGPGVRMGRIKVLESELRKSEKSATEYADRFNAWKQVLTMEETRANRLAYVLVCGSSSWADYIHPRTGKKQSLYDMMRAGSYDGPNLDRITGYEAAALWLDGMDDPESEEYSAAPWQRSITHLRNRIAYENQMLEAQGGRAGDMEIEVGGFWGGQQIHKVNKSTTTGRVVSVHVEGPRSERWTYRAANVAGTDYALHQFDTERAAPGSYRAPTPEELAEFQAAAKVRKAAAKATAPPTIPLINPTPADAQRLQDMLNARHAKDAARYETPKASEVLSCPQAVYSANSKGSYARAETITYHAGATERDTGWNSRASSHNRLIGPAVCKVRTTGYHPRRVVVLTDKPQKALPAALWMPFASPVEAVTA